MLSTLGASMATTATLPAILLLTSLSAPTLVAMATCGDPVMADSPLQLSCRGESTVPYLILYWVREDGYGQEEDLVDHDLDPGCTHSNNYQATSCWDGTTFSSNITILEMSLRQDGDVFSCFTDDGDTERLITSCVARVYRKPQAVACRASVSPGGATSGRARIQVECSAQGGYPDVSCLVETDGPGTPELPERLASNYSTDCDQRVCTHNCSAEIPVHTPGTYRFRVRISPKVNGSVLAGKYLERTTESVEILELKHLGGQGLTSLSQSGRKGSLDLHSVIFYTALGVVAAVCLVVVVAGAILLICRWDDLYSYFPVSGKEQKGVPLPPVESGHRRGRLSTPRLSEGVYSQTSASDVEEEERYDEVVLTSDFPQSRAPPRPHLFYTGRAEQPGQDSGVHVFELGLRGGSDGAAQSDDYLQPQSATPVGGLSNGSPSIPPAIPSTVPPPRPHVFPSLLPPTVPTPIPPTVPTSIPPAVPTSIPPAVPTSIPPAVPTSIPPAVPASIPPAVPCTIQSKNPPTQPPSVPTTTIPLLPAAFHPSAPTTVLQTALPPLPTSTTTSITHRDPTTQFMTTIPPDPTTPFMTTIPSNPTTTGTIPLDPTTKATIPPDPTTPFMTTIPPDPTTPFMTTIPPNPTTTGTIPLDPTTKSTIPPDPTTKATIALDPTTTATVPLDPTTTATIPVDPTATITIPSDPTTHSDPPTTLPPNIPANVHTNLHFPRPHHNIVSPTAGLDSPQSRAYEVCPDSEYFPGEQTNRHKRRQTHTPDPTSSDDDNNALGGM